MAKSTPGRVVMPTSPKGKLDLAALIYAKHLKDGAGSELNNLVDYDWEITGPTIATALDYDKQATELRKQMEDLYRQRDALLKPIDEINKASAKYLKGKYSKTPKKLSEWGYPVDDTPRPKKPE